MSSTTKKGNNFFSEYFEANKQAENFRKLRFLLGMSQAQLAKSCKVTKQTICKIEKGKMDVSIKLGLTVLNVAHKNNLYFDMKYILPKKSAKLLFDNFYGDHKL